MAISVLRQVQKLLNLMGVCLISRNHRILLEEAANPRVTDLLKRFRINCSSVLHIGAHFGEEADEYYEYGIKSGIFIEGDPEIYISLVDKLRSFANYSSICALISEHEHEVAFFRASNEGASSSILRPARHQDERPDITFETPNIMTTTSLDSLQLGHFDLVVVDVQGAELRVIAGGIKTVSTAKAIWIEVNSGNMYEGDADSSEIIRALSSDFIPVYLNMNNNFWGDALLLNRNVLKSKQFSEYKE